MTLEKFLRPLARGLSPELARALVHLTADEETQARCDGVESFGIEAITPAQMLMKSRELK